MPIVVEAVEQTDYLIWSILKEGMPDNVEISGESVGDFYYTDGQGDFADTNCNGCERVLGKA
jgi:hypothetical protein